MGPIPTIKLFTLWQIYQHCLAELCPENTGGQCNIAKKFNNNFDNNAENKGNS